jgi:FAD/FMN-containing dehydrogenase
MNSPAADPSLRDVMGTSAAILLTEVEGETEAAAKAAAEKVAKSFREVGATTVDIALTPEREHALWELRHAASPILAALDQSTSMQFIEDGAVALSKLPAYVDGVRQALEGRAVSGVIFGHAGDAHVHVNPLIDVQEPDWRAKVTGLLDDIVALTSRLGGTLSGEHGDGRLRTPLLTKVWSKEALKAFALVKKAFDPANILNPGVKIPLPNQKAIEDIKYDPALPPLPAEVRAALDSMVKTRAYSEFRLSLIGGSS